MDPSILNLKNDPHKHVSNAKGKKDDVVVSLDRQEDRRLRLSLYKFFEEKGGQGFFKKVLSGDQVKQLKSTDSIPKQVPGSKGLQGPSTIDLTFDENQVIDLDEEEQKKDLGAPSFPSKKKSDKEDKPQNSDFDKPWEPEEEQENWGDYESMDISSLNRDTGIRKYYKRLH